MAGTPNGSSISPYTEASPSLFEPSVAPIGVSGGTASFYRLRFLGDGRSPSYYIGKDLSHAQDEVDFYEQASALIQEQKDGPMSPILNFVFEYAGVLTAHSSDNNPSGSPVKLLVLKNLYDGCSKLRMLDMKIGKLTAAANWKGKPLHRSMVQNVRDYLTNSVEEGFRLEGFDGAPPALASMDHICSGPKTGRGKRYYFRQLLQQMRCSDILMHFLDVHQLPEDPGDGNLNESRSPSEVCEVVLRAVVRRLLELSLACRSVPAPQKWIGSSVALCFDYDCLPSRSASDEEVCKSANVKVQIFDWGRSDLNTPEKHDLLPPAQQADFGKFWGYYIAGVDRLAWEAARAYKHRFGNSIGWTEALLSLVDFDCSGYDQVLGYVKVAPLQPIRETTAQVLDSRGVVLEGNGQPVTLTYSVEYRPYPAGSHLRAAWRVRILRAANLPRVGFKGRPDSFVELIVFSDPTRGEERYGFRQITSVRNGEVDPHWDEVFEVPVAARSSVLEEVLTNMSPCFGGISTMLPREEVVVHGFHVAEKLPSARGDHVADKRSNHRLSVIAVGEGVDDEACILKWRERVEQVTSMRLSQEVSEQLSRHSSVPTQELGRAEVLRLIYQPSFTVRVLAVAGVMWSMLLSLLVLFRWAWWIAWPEDCIALAVAFIQLSVGPIALLFETRPRKATSIGCDKCMDRVMEITGIHRVSRRGMLYVMQGSAWTFCSFLWGDDLPVGNTAALALGVYLCIIGVLLLGAHCGAMRQHVVRKVSRGLTSESCRLTNDLETCCTHADGNSPIRGSSSTWHRFTSGAGPKSISSKEMGSARSSTASNVVTDIEMAERRSVTSS